ncbi:hypothetical protein C4K04_5294 [Pseudomonas chlororaphis]|uniref:Uncharacterized protein n=1 Tax=Pseudomonas chlororaphis TaxID=587753 RepID=A0A3G7TUZ6_9PSED|nr:hypothetical protein C4K04_5294 [Pseudomonas chlororaphis]
MLTRLSASASPALLSERPVAARLAALVLYFLDDGRRQTL